MADTADKTGDRIGEGTMGAFDDEADDDGDNAADDGDARSLCCGKILILSLRTCCCDG